MGKLMKYEFRKTRLSKLVILGIALAAEIAILAGIFLEWDLGAVTGSGVLVFTAIVGTAYIGIESLMVLSRDLNSKQSYMLFLTPKNSFQILGAKVLENFISIFGAGAFFTALGLLSFAVAGMKNGGIRQLLDSIDWLLASVDIRLTPQMVVLVFFSCLAGWLMIVTAAFLAIVLSATVLAGKRLSGLVSFVIFLLIDTGLGKLLDLLPTVDYEVGFNLLVIPATLVFSAGMYLLTGWIMEKKLSV